ncbi:hypothetical protein V440_15510 [Clostridioides difficile]|nr:hypothetical protein V440_15510 [Clostridioides difficile]
MQNYKIILNHVQLFGMALHVENIDNKIKEVV